MFCIQCGTQIPDDKTSCPSCGTQTPTRQADHPAAASAPIAAATVPQKSTNNIIWIVGAAVAILVIIIGYFVLASDSNQKLTTQRVQQTLGQWSNGGIVVTGVQEIPQQNAASATLLFSNFNVRQQGLFGGTITRAYTGPGEATLTHYTDGRWVLMLKYQPPRALTAPSGTTSISRSTKRRAFCRVVGVSRSPRDSGKKMKKNPDTQQSDTGSSAGSDAPVAAGWLSVR